MRLKISEIVKACGGKLLCGDENTPVTSFFTDSRQAKAGAMFVPIRGENTDGHRYIGAALEAGACASFTDHEVPPGEKPLVLVHDCRQAPAENRRLVPVPVRHPCGGHHRQRG